MSFAKSVYWRLVHPVLRRLGSLPSPSEKVRLLVRYGARYSTLVETGTYRGDTVAGCLPHFEHIYTIELDERLYEKARHRFRSEPVTVIHGDSETELLRLVATIEEPTVFWLDAHFCENQTAKGVHDPPLMWELQAIVERGKPDTILIDDARHLGLQPGSLARWVRRHFLRLPVRPDYPTMDEVRKILNGRDSSFEARRDIVRIVLDDGR